MMQPYKEYLKERINSILNSDLFCKDNAIVKLIETQNNIMSAIYVYCINAMWETNEIATIKTDPTYFLVNKILEIEENEKGFEIIFEGQTKGYGSFRYDKYKYKCSADNVHSELIDVDKMYTKDDPYYESIELVK